MRLFDIHEIEAPFARYLLANRLPSFCSSKRRTSSAPPSEPRSHNSHGMVRRNAGYTEAILQSVACFLYRIHIYDMPFSL